MMVKRRQLVHKSGYVDQGCARGTRKTASPPRPLRHQGIGMGTPGRDLAHPR